MIKTWILVFMFHWQPMASGPHELDVCLYMAQQARQKAFGIFKAHCYNPKEHRREYPRTGVDYLPMSKETK